MKSLFSFALVAGLLFANAGYAQQRATIPQPQAATPVSSSTSPTAIAQNEAPTPATDELACRVLTGRVTDAFDHPLTGVTVMLRGRTKAFSADACITNAEGEFMINSKQPIPLNTMLEVSAGGYNTFTVPLTNCKPVDATLEPLPGTRFKSDGRIKKTSASGKIH